MELTPPIAEQLGAATCNANPLAHAHPTKPLTDVVTWPALQLPVLVIMFLHQGNWQLHRKPPSDLKAGGGVSMAKGAYWLVRCTKALTMKNDGLGKLPLHSFADLREAV